MADVPIARVPSLIVADATLIRTGLTSNESFPSMASVNGNYTHFNQAVALYNRRTNQVMGTPDISPYLNSTSIGASAITALRTRINTLRALLGIAAVSYTHTTLSAGNKIAKVDLDELFTGLTLTSPSSSAADHWYSKEQDEPYGTIVSGTHVNTTNATGLSTQFIGKQHGTSGTHPTAIARGRLGLSFPIPTGLATTTTGTLHFNTANLIQTIEAALIAVYASNTDDHAGSGTWYSNLDHFLGIGNTITVSGAIIAAASGFLSFVVGQSVTSVGNDGELAGAGLSGTSGQSASFTWDTTTAGATLALSFGF